MGTVVKHIDLTVEDGDITTARDYAAVFNGSRVTVDLVPTVCTVGYKYGVGSADLRAQLRRTSSGTAALAIFRIALNAKQLRDIIRRRK